MGLDGSGHPTKYEHMHEHKEIISRNPKGLDLLPSPHNFSSNPGFIDNAADATSSAYDKAKQSVLGAAKSVSDKYKAVKENYTSTAQEFKSLGGELKQTSDSYRDNQKGFDEQKAKDAANQ
jgi:hypothetical protein